jgi:hypothetical protein
VQYSSDQYAWGPELGHPVRDQPPARWKQRFWRSAVALPALSLTVLRGG